MIPDLEQDLINRYGQGRDQPEMPEYTVHAIDKQIKKVDKA